MQIELIVGCLRADASPAADGNFAGSVVHRMRTQFADRLPGAGSEAQAAGEAPHEPVGNGVRAVEIANLPTIRVQEALHKLLAQHTKRAIGEIKKRADAG